jgi:hypothetical protein
MTAVLASCTENMTYRDAGVVASGGPNLPVDGYYLELQGGAGISTSFTWHPGACEDGYPVQYEIVFFDSPTSGKEVGRVDAGLKTSVSITHKVLNNLANTAGIESNAVGSLYWAVNVSRGLNQVVSQLRYRIDIKRLLGFPYIPPKLYLIGAGTEANGSTAVPFHTIADGEYEIYTQFSSGDYLIVDDAENPQYSYVIQGSQVAEASAPVAAPAEGIYKISLDFNVKSAVSKKIERVEHWFCTKSERSPMSYIGRGVWLLSDHYLDAWDYWKDGTPSGKDDRYHFRVRLAGNVEECWGPVNSGEDGKPSSIEATNEYFYLKAYGDGFDQWGPKFKYHASVCEKTVDIYVDMSCTTIPQPTHRFILK